MNRASFLWYDLETWGKDPRQDGIAQFACQRTDLELEPIEPPTEVWFRPPLDRLPSPEAMLITGLDPFDLAERGLPECAAVARVAAVLAEPGTCAVGWNTLRFDDEFLRFAFWRNFHDPYAREWQNDNSRWDLLDFARLAHALRPQGLRWPQRDDGATSFRLEQLAAANGIAHNSAHEAGSDVAATLGLARLLRSAQPRLWDYHLGFRNKRRALALLDIAAGAPVLHVSVQFPAERRHAALVLPITLNPTVSNRVITVDLQDDPTALLELDARAIAARVFVRRDQLPAGVARIPLKEVHINRCPALVALNHVTDPELQGMGLDRKQALRHAEQLAGDAGLAEKLRQVYQRGADAFPEADVDSALYSALPDPRDLQLGTQIRRTAPVGLAALNTRCRDAATEERLFRYRARNFPETLDAADRQRWQALRRQRLLQGDPSPWSAFDAELARLRRESLEPSQLKLLDRAESWAAQLRGSLDS